MTTDTEKLLKAVRSGSDTEMYKALYPQLATLDSQLKGEIPDEKVAEVAHFRGNRLITLTEITRAPPYSTKTAFFKNLKPNPRKELLGTVKGRGFETLKTYAYYDRPVSELSSTTHKAKRGLLVAGGGVHPILFSLDMSEAKRLYNILQRLIRRLRKREISEKPKNLITIDIRYGGRAWKADKEAE